MKKPEDRTKEQLINSQRMGIRTVAEGVETEEQLAFLRAVECDEAQGFLFNWPLPPEKFREIRHRRRPLMAMVQANRVVSQLSSLRCRHDQLAAGYHERDDIWVIRLERYC